MNDQSKVSVEAVRWATQTRFNSLRGLTPASLTQMLVQWDQGYVQQFAALAEKIIERDDTLISVVPKRFSSVASLPWEILTKSDKPQAKLHQEALLYCYNNLISQNATDLDEQGSVGGLIKHMMSAVGVRHAVQEVIWQQRGSNITLITRHVPLYFFERTTGKLRFLRNPADITGVDMLPGEWLVHVGSPLMIASAVAYMFKRLPLRDWLNFTEKFGMPLLQLITSAKKGSTDWEAAVATLEAVASDYAAVVSEGNKLDVDNSANFGGNPFEALIDRMDRALARIWRGADLSTVSKGNGTGASLQGDESNMLLEWDAAAISETLQQRVDRFLIEYVFGRGVEPLAYFKLKPPQPRDITTDMLVDNHLAERGVKLSKLAALERYQRTEATKEDDALTVTSPEPKEEFPALANEADQALKQAATITLLRATGEDMRPVINRLLVIADMTDATAQAEALQALWKEAPELLKQINQNSQTVTALKDIFGTAVAQGLSQ